MEYRSRHKTRTLDWLDSSSKRPEVDSVNSECRAKLTISVCSIVPLLLQAGMANTSMVKCQAMDRSKATSVSLPAHFLKYKSRLVSPHPNLNAAYASACCPAF